MVYKVIFKGSNKIEKEKLSLTFKEVDLDSILRISEEYINKLKKIRDKEIINFQNIETVIRFGPNGSPSNYNYYNVILFSYNENRQGMLIGNLKNKGDVLIGIWPFDKELNKEALEYLNQIFNDLIITPNKFQEICIIN
ncbi:MAG: hypothetical protein KGD63_12520 [Candidatus Lokiarchaeota archaeon]|nr:hypothetical protein [Candidatus Lokiarchaeota archaeon]